MFLSVSVPKSLLPDQSAAPDVDADGDIKMETTKQQEQELKARVTVPESGCLCGGWMYGKEGV